MGSRVTLTGEKELIRRLNKLKDKSKVQAVVKTNTLEFEREAKANAPVDTGFLRRGIQSKVGNLEGRITSTAEYSGYLEYGTRYMVAQPFMKPAYDQVKDQFKAQLKKAVEDS